MLNVPNPFILHEKHGHDTLLFQIPACYTEPDKSYFHGTHEIDARIIAKSCIILTWNLANLHVVKTHVRARANVTQLILVTSTHAV